MTAKARGEGRRVGVSSMIVSFADDQEKQGHALCVSSGSQIANSWYRAHSTHCMRFFWFCCASFFVDNVSWVISGQSFRKSRSSSRRFVRNSETLEIP